MDRKEYSKNGWMNHKKFRMTKNERKISEKLSLKTDIYFIKETFPLNLKESTD